MMKLSRISDYGIVLMTLIANRDDDAAPHNAREVAAQAELPLPVVSKILKSLAREGLLVSHRGAKGMIAALDGPIGLTECTVHPGQCVQEASCHVREPWQRINDVVRRALTSVTLADLARPAAPPAPDTIPLSQLGVSAPERAGR
jgi:Rrf2 family protein